MTYEDTLRALIASDPSVVVLTAENRAAIRNLPREIGNRFVDFGICEQTMVGAAAGLALRGRTPIVHALATFLTLRAFEFIRTDVGIAGLPVKLVGGVPGFLSEANGPTHQAIEDISLMRGIPGMNVFCPADENELTEALPAIVADRAPWYIRYNASPPAVSHVQPFAIGKAEILSEGSDLAILSYGFILREAAVAMNLLKSSGLGVRLVNMRTLAPADHEAILAAARETRAIAVIEDHFLTGGLSTIVSEVLARNGVAARLIPISLEHRWFKPTLLDKVLEVEGYTGAQLAARITASLNS